MSADRADTVEPLTLEEFQRLPEEDEHRVELVRGRIVREPRPGARHGWLAGRIYVILEAYGRETGFGMAAIETGFLLAEDPPTVRGPDVAFIAEERLPAEGIPVGFWPLAPDLAVEVVSPSNSAAEIQEKVLDYLAVGTRLVWVVDPDTGSVTVYRSRDDVRVRTKGDALDGGDVLPGFRLEVTDLFEPPDVRTG